MHYRCLQVHTWAWWRSWTICKHWASMPLSCCPSRNSTSSNIIRCSPWVPKSVNPSQNRTHITSQNTLQQTGIPKASLCIMASLDSCPACINRGATQLTGSTASSTFSAILRSMIRNPTMAAATPCKENHSCVLLMQLIPGTDSNYRYNYWGYSTIGFFAPMARYSQAAAEGRGGHDVVKEFKTMVKECHRRGIEVLMDVVFNHTAEGNERGPTLSFRWTLSAAPILDNATAAHCLCCDDIAVHLDLGTFAVLSEQFPLQCKLPSSKGSRYMPCPYSGIYQLPCHLIS